MKAQNLRKIKELQDLTDEDNRPANRSQNSGRCNHGDFVEDNFEDQRKGTPESIQRSLTYACPLGFIDISIEGRKVRALVDTGAEMNIMSESLAIQLKLPLREISMNITGIGGHSTRIRGTHKAESTKAYVIRAVEVHLNLDRSILPSLVASGLAFLRTSNTSPGSRILPEQYCSSSPVSTTSPTSTSSSSGPNKKACFLRSATTLVVRLQHPNVAPLLASILMSSTRSSGNLLIPPTDPESILRAALAEKRCLAKILANTTEPNVHVPATSHPSTSFHTPATSSPGTPAEPPFTPSLLRTKLMSDPPNPTDTSPAGGADAPKVPEPPKRGNSSTSKGGGNSSPSVAGKIPMADHYVELLLKLQHTAAVQLQEERQNNIEQRRADRERIARLENTLFDVVTKAEEEKQIRLSPTPKSDRLDLQKFRIADGPHYTGPSHSIEPFLKWVQQLQIFFATKGVVNDGDKICIAGGLLEETKLLDFYAYESASFANQPWDAFKTRLFEVALPQQWRTTLKTNLRQMSMGPTEFTRLPDFDVAEFVVLGVPEELRGEITKFALLDVNPFTYATFEKRAAVFDEVIKKKVNHRTQRSAPRAQSPTSSLPDPAAWRVHAYLDSQGQCHHCKTTCGSTYGACTKPLNKRWVDIPASFQTPPQPANYQPPKALGTPASTAGKPTHPPAGCPPLRSASVAAVSKTPTDVTNTSGTDYVDVVDAIDMDHLTFDEAIIDDSLPPDLTPGDYAIFKEIDDIRSDNIAGVVEDEYVPALPTSLPPLTLGRVGMSPHSSGPSGLLE
ncbi:hypothetical protein PSTG_10890 [Puccinia striiformis f. sp. tritici PST-78]|uniref:Peptidase A2 domain-containing protein n=1 Tax=Puccinia striiformis f. sp. tritici PST-78 TaxID=1165861 RepID=A0A0L0V962_9BASI|nr:hypothetical protein PSTG_10890 [Puccinia striiformis f. sp. tritici PST-78]